MAHNQTIGATEMKLSVQTDIQPAEDDAASVEVLKDNLTGAIDGCIKAFGYEVINPPITLTVEE
jgi:hypothetical protein